MCREEQEGFGVILHGDLFRLYLDGLGNGLSLAVLHIELLCELTSAHEVGCGEQFKRCQCGFESARGIETRSQHKADVARSGLVYFHIGDACQREEALSLCFADLSKSFADQHTIFTDKRGKVSDGSQRN